MQGVILDEFRRYVAQRFGFRAWTRVLAAAGRPETQHYSLDDVYPDEELGLLTLKTCELTGKTQADVLVAFGETLLPEMTRMYSYLVDPKWSYGDFLVHMEPLLHEALQLHTAGVQPTKVQAARVGPEAVEVVYESPLRACAAVEGVIRGAAVEYGVKVQVSQPECVLRGDARCRFEVTFSGSRSGSPRA